MRNYTVVVVPGAGRMSKHMEASSHTIELYEKETGLDLIPGTLNVRLRSEVNMPSRSKQIVRQEHGDRATIYITPAVINDIECFAIRSKLAEDGMGRHPKSIIELISAYNLREKLGVKDGDIVTVRM